jgi:hypothetical protein
MRIAEESMFDFWGNPATTVKQRCYISLDKAALRVKTPYNQAFVAGIKSIPAPMRSFDGDTKEWLIDPSYGQQIAELIKQVFGENVALPNYPNAVVSSEKRILDVWYLGTTKNKGGDEPEAFGMNCLKQWEFIFPESALREWFEGIENRFISATTLYGILGVQRNALAEDIKSAYRRAARQWHPDICKEPNAQEVFLKIKEAYELLSEPSKRARYDAGLALEATLSTTRSESIALGSYRSPLRCGYILAKGTARIGRFVVEEIEAWEDITSDQGVLVASWPAGANEPVWQWV